jgi:hypothetical protein
VGFGYLHELYLAVAAAQSSDPVVIDSDDLVTRTEATVRAYCDRIGLPFDGAALQWSPTKSDQWRLTERWHTDVSASTGFTARATEYADTVHNHATLADYYRHHLPFFEYLHARRLVIA